MQLSGFVSGQKIQPEGVSHTILLILSVGTLVVLACGFLVSLRFKLNLHTPQRPAQRDPQNARARLRSVGTDQCGTPCGGRAAGGDSLYDCLWGNNNIGHLNRVINLLPRRAH